MNGLQRPLSWLVSATIPPAHAPLALFRPDHLCATRHHHHYHHYQQKRLSSTSSTTTDAESTPHLNPDINPLPTTRPPTLAVPPRPSTGITIRYLAGLGQAYVRFYKSGVRAILTNRRAILARIDALPVEDRPRLYSPQHPSVPPPRSFSRADWVLLWRARRDLARTPLFTLVLIITGEFTPLLVPWLDPIIPGTCRIPSQVRGALEAAERRRAEAFDELDGTVGDRAGGAIHSLSRTDARSHMLRSLHLTSRLWDFFGPLVPTAARWAIGRGASRLAFLEGDDALLARSSEGVSGLVPDEVRIACAERGVDVLGRGDSELRALLGDWLRLTAAAEAGERRRRMAVLLALRPEEWPETRDFELPEWEL